MYHVAEVLLFYHTQAVRQSEEVTGWVPVM